MKRFISGADRSQSTLLPECLDDWVDDSNPVRAIDVFVDSLDLGDLGFAGVTPSATGRPAYHPAVLLKLYIYGYLNRVQSSRRLEREAGRNLEVIWLLGRLVPDDKVIADFRKDNGPAIKQVCARFVDLCREMGLLATASVAIDGSKFKAVNNRDRNFTKGKVERRRQQLEESVARYLSQLDTADQQLPTLALAIKAEHLKQKLAKLKGNRLPRTTAAAGDGSCGLVKHIVLTHVAKDGFGHDARSDCDGRATAPLAGRREASDHERGARAGFGRCGGRRPERGVPVASLHVASTCPAGAARAHRAGPAGWREEDAVRGGFGRDTSFV